MPLGRCDACNTKLRFGSATCTRCGARKSRLKTLFIGVILLQAGTIVWYEYFHTKAPGFGFVAAGPDRFTAPAIDRTPPAGWLYFDTTDDLVHDTTRHARVLSRGAAHTGAPGDSSTNGVMELRASLIYGRSAVLTLDRQAFDTVDDTCTLHAEFDTGTALDLPASCSSDTAHATIMVQNAGPFIDDITAAHNLSIDVALSAKTKRSAMFDVGNLKL